jgi:histidyl-tRNA synthetase
VSPRLVRGLDYYVRTTFELTTTELGAQNAVAGGGRYDGLIKLLGGPPDPGIGFAVGVERVVQLLPDEGPEAWGGRGPGVFLIPLGEAALTRLLPVANLLRSRGVVVEVGHGERKLGKELERANKLEHAKRLGVLHAVILGPDELTRGEAIVRELGSGAQRTVELSRLADELLALGGRA